MMLQLTQYSDIFVAIKPVDFRKQIDGLIGLCQNSLQMKANSGQLFVFINRSRTMIRILAYDGMGYWLTTNRLSRGRFTGWPKAGTVCSQLQAAQLRSILTTTTVHHD